MKGEVDAVIARILATEAFRKSARLSTLFRYLAEHSTNDRQDLLSEQQVGIAVFDRRPGYNASDDSVVRVQVHNLRERLADYFAGEGAAEQIVATIPKGRYGLVFSHRATAPETKSTPEASDGSVSGRHNMLWSAIVVSVLAFSTGVIVDRFWTKPAPALPLRSEEAPINPVLGSVLSPAADTIVVIEDTMLVVTAMLRGAPYKLTEFVVSGDRPPDFSGAFSRGDVRGRVEWLIAMARYVNLANVSFVTRLLRSYPQVSRKTVFRHPREVQLRDVRSSNCILFGAQLSNPWVDLYEDRMNFHLRPFTVGDGFENRQPKPGERKVYGDAGDRYARIVLMKNFEAGTHVLILTGQGGAETEAVAQMLLAPNFLEQLPGELRAQLRVPPAYLEILLSAQRIGTSVSRTQVVAWRTSENARPPSE